jgi:hypothetical protein
MTTFASTLPATQPDFQSATRSHTITPGDARPNGRPRLDYRFNPVPRRMKKERVALQARELWEHVTEISRGSNQVTLSWAQIGRGIGRDRQWVGEWARHLHNIGWATIVPTGHRVNTLVLHTAPEQAAPFREHRPQTAGELYTQTSARGAARPRDEPPAETAAQPRPQVAQPRADPTYTYANDRPVHTDPPVPRAPVPPPDRAPAHPGSNPHAERSSCPACGPERARDPRRAPAPAHREPKRAPAAPYRPSVHPELAGLHRELLSAGLDPGWGSMTPAQETTLRELLRLLGARRMAKIAADHTRRVVEQGRGPALYVQAYLRIWLDRAPLFAPQPAPPAPVPRPETAPERAEPPVSREQARTLMLDELAEGRERAKARGLIKPPR